MIAWHYTTGECFEQIVAAGFLRPAVVGLDPGERPICWFTTNQEWEPTANKGVMGADGSRRDGTKEDTRTLGRGLVRFGIDEQKLIPWPKLARKSRMTAETMESLERTAKEHGSNPKQWRGVFHGIDLRALTVEVMDDGGAWERVKESELAT